MPEGHDLSGAPFRHACEFLQREQIRSPDHLLGNVALHLRQGRIVVCPARLRLRGKAPRRLRFELGLRSEAPALLSYDAGDRLSPAVHASCPESQ